MRILITFLLSAIVMLNAASAAVFGICDALEHGNAHGVDADRGNHPGHHSHAHAEHGSTDANAAVDDANPAHEACALGHAHPLFSPMVSVAPPLPALSGRSPLVAFHAAALVSVPPARLERPPRASLA